MQTPLERAQGRLLELAPQPQDWLSTARKAYGNDFGGSQSVSAQAEIVHAETGVPPASTEAQAAQAIGSKVLTWIFWAHDPEAAPAAAAYLTRQDRVFAHELGIQARRGASEDEIAELEADTIDRFEIWSNVVQHLPADTEQDFMERASRAILLLGEHEAKTLSGMYLRYIGQEIEIRRLGVGPADDEAFQRLQNRVLEADIRLEDAMEAGASIESLEQRQLDILLAEVEALLFHESIAKEQIEQLIDEFFHQRSDVDRMVILYGYSHRILSYLVAPEGIDIERHFVALPGSSEKAHLRKLHAAYGVLQEMLRVSDVYPAEEMQYVLLTQLVNEFYREGLPNMPKLSPRQLQNLSQSLRRLWAKDAKTATAKGYSQFEARKARTRTLFESYLASV